MKGHWYTMKVTVMIEAETGDELKVGVANLHHSLNNLSTAVAGANAPKEGPKSAVGRPKSKPAEEAPSAKEEKPVEKKAAPAPTAKKAAAAEKPKVEDDPFGDDEEADTEELEEVEAEEDQAEATIEELKEALGELNETKGVDELRKVLTSLGVRKVAAIPQEKWREAINLAKKALK